MKILFCDVSLNGQLNFRGEIIKDYVHRGYEVVLVSPQDQEYDPNSSNIKYVPIKMNRSSKNPIHDLGYLLELRKIYKREAPDYIFHYSIKPNIYGTLAAHICRIPSSAMLAGLGYVFYNKNWVCKWVRKLYKFALNFSQYVLVLNEDNRKYLISTKMVCENKLIHLIGGEGVDLKYFMPSVKIKNESITFLMVSRILYEKGYTEYVQAAEAVKRKYPFVEFQLLGVIDTAYPNHVPESIIIKDNERGVINYLGHTLDVIPFIQSASCVVLPSFYNEGLSRSLMEAIAMGKPVITTNIPGCRETVEDGRNGYLVPPKNAMALKDAFEEFLNLSVTEREEMGKYSRVKAEQEFDIKHVIDVYRRITASVERNYL